MLIGAAAKLSHVAEKFSTFYTEIEQERQVQDALSDCAAKQVKVTTSCSIGSQRPGSQQIPGLVAP